MFISACKLKSQLKNTSALPNSIITKNKINTVWVQRQFLTHGKGWSELCDSDWYVIHSTYALISPYKISCLTAKNILNGCFAFYLSWTVAHTDYN